MTPPKQYVSRIRGAGEILGLLARLPAVLAEACSRWDEIEVIVRKRVKRRSLDQNRLQRLWCKEAAAQGDMDAEEYRGYCKYHFGLAILCRDDDDYRQACKRVLGALTYEQRLLLMQEPHDYPVTRGMTAAQKREYLDRCWEHFTGLGMTLTDPNLKGIVPDDYREAA